MTVDVGDLLRLVLAFLAAVAVVGLLCELVHYRRDQVRRLALGALLIGCTIVVLDNVLHHDEPPLWWRLVLRYLAVSLSLAYLRRCRRGA